MKRGDFIKKTLGVAPLVITGIDLIGFGSLTPDQDTDLLKKGYSLLFDGKTLKGWHAEPRLTVPDSPGAKETYRQSERYKKASIGMAKWTVEDGAIIGAQDPPGSGLGGYLVSDETFGDFELVLDAKPDWPVDTGILVRAGLTGAPGFQILVDHRKSGGIGAFYGNGLANFHAIAYNFDAIYDAGGKPIGLKAEVPSTTNEPVTDAKRNLLAYAAPVEEFLKTWKWADWNTFKIRCEGKYPYLTTWINGVKICEMDTAKIIHPNYNNEEVAKLLGREGRISFEVHDNDPKLGKDRWYPGNVCRWKNIYIKKLS